MHITLLHNADADALEEDPGREARADVERVAAELSRTLVVDGFEVTVLPVGPSPADIVAPLATRPTDLVLNLCESIGGDARGEMAIPALLDLLGLPYSGSGPLALGLALHKDKAKELLVARSVPTPPFRVVERLAQLDTIELPFPLIVKPSREDASVGVDFDSVVEDERSLRDAVRRVLRTFKQPALVERFIPGREVYVSLLGNTPRTALPLSEIRFGQTFAGKPHIVSYRAKWEPSSPECVDSPSVPCTLPRELEARVVDTALAAFEALGCRDYGRVDLRLSDDGRPWVIDINPNCDLHPEAGFARSAAAAGLPYSALALRLVDVALERTHGHPSRRPRRQGRPREAPRPHRELLTRRGALRARGHRPGVAAE
ncbi:MAG TPA: ATP-grasp domain-containing protein [Myxococcaceae bacterium]|nr:ATP-grasp domain-containing protein [Myxococcaceae bacterium]